MLRLKLLTVSAALLLFLSQAPAAHAQQSYANGLIRSVSSPELQPGQGGTLSVQVANPFNGTMSNIRFTLSIYAFADGSTNRAAASIPPSRLPYFTGSGSAAETMSIASIPAGGMSSIGYPLQTNYTTPHGTFFNRATYMVSMSILFSVGHTPYRMASKGYFSSSQWQKIYVLNGTSASLNYTYLNSTLGFAGILPDTSFGVNTPAPWSIFFGSGALAAVCAAAAFFSYRKTHSRRRGR